jgi:predicted TIM-barrel fold metal-dependent hydrolase
VPKRNLLANPAWIDGLRSLRDHGLSFDLLIWAHQLEQACEVFRAIPDLQVILEHTGLPPAGDLAELSRWRSGMRRFATEVPNSVLKISAMSFIATPWSPQEVGPLVRESIEIFGPHRCMFGSNFPVERRALSYGELWRAYQTMVSGYSDAEQRAMFADTASRVYRLPPA